MRIRVQYFAALREKSGLRSEEIQTEARTAGELFDELTARHNFELPPSLVRPSVNLQMVEMDSPLADGDTVVFIPPVAGG